MRCEWTWIWMSVSWATPAWTPYPHWSTLIKAVRVHCIIDRILYIRLLWRRHSVLLQRIWTVIDVWTDIFWIRRGRRRIAAVIHDILKGNPRGSHTLSVLISLQPTLKLLVCPDEIALSPRNIAFKIQWHSRCYDSSQTQAVVFWFPLTATTVIATQFIRSKFGFANVIQQISDIVDTEYVWWMMK